MRKIGSFNDLYPATEKNLPILNPGQEAVYEWVKFEKDHITGRPLYGGARTLTLRDRIMDSYIEQTTDKGQQKHNKFVDIGVPRVIDGDKVKKVMKLTITGGGENASVPPRFTLSGDNVDDIEIHQFLSICNFNESNPNASPNAEKLIRRVDFLKESRDRKYKRQLLHKATAAIDEMKLEDVRMYCASLNWPLNERSEVLREKLGDWAIKNPQAFVDMMEDDDIKIKAEIVVAANNGVVFYDRSTHTVKDDAGNTLATLEKLEGKEWNECFAVFVKTNKNAGPVLAGIRKKVASVLRRKQNGNDAADDNIEQTED